MEPQNLPPLSTGDERLLEDLMTGTRAPDEPAVAERLEASDSLRLAYERLLDAQDALQANGPPPSLPDGEGDPEGTHPFGNSEADAESEHHGDADQVREILLNEGLLAPAGGRNWMALAAMCMVLLGAGLLALEAWNRSRPGETPGQGRLILSEQAIPSGPVEDFLEFRAPVVLQDGEQLRITVYADGQASIDPLDSGPLDAPIWLPSPTELERLRSCSRIRWTYEILSVQRPPAPVEVFARLASSSR